MIAFRRVFQRSFDSGRVVINLQGCNAENWEHIDPVALEKVMMLSLRIRQGKKEFVRQVVVLNPINVVLVSGIKNPHNNSILSVLFIYHHAWYEKLFYIRRRYIEYSAISVFILEHCLPSKLSCTILSSGNYWATIFHYSSILDMTSSWSKFWLLLTESNLCCILNSLFCVWLSK